MSAPWTPPGPAWLFCPADRPERFAKAAAAADVVILDLEDGVAPADKPAARAALARVRLDAERTVVRVGHDDDLAAVRLAGYRLLMVAKCESAADVERWQPHPAVALIETPRGALAANEIAAAANTMGIMWGAEDLVAGLGGSSSRHPDGGYRDVARQVRSMALLAAKAHDRLALDAVHMEIGDVAGLRVEAVDAAAVGFDGTVAIHPSQVPVIREAYAPTDADLVWARAVLAEAAHHGGVFTFAGKMVDAPVLRHAERIVRNGARE